MSIINNDQETKLNSTEEEHNSELDTPNKKRSLGVYFVLMIVCSIGSGLAGEVLGLNPVVSWGITGIFMLGAVVLMVRMALAEERKKPKPDKAASKRALIVTGVIVAVTAILLLAGQGSAAFTFLIFSVILCLIYLWAYELVEPYAKDRKSAIQLAITIMFVIAVAAYASKQAQRPAPGNQVVPATNR